MTVTPVSARDGARESSILVAAISIALTIALAGGCVTVLGHRLMGAAKVGLLVEVIFVAPAGLGAAAARRSPGRIREKVAAASVVAVISAIPLQWVNATGEVGLGDPFDTFASVVFCLLLVIVWAVALSLVQPRTTGA